MSDKIKELKVKAYDLLALIQAYQMELQNVNQEISKLSQENKEDVKQERNQSN